MSDTYAGQLRGDRSAYERYLAGMDASMQQKVALTAAHILGQGRIADMGMGSGAGSHALAALYPELRVTGVDVSQEMVTIAQERFDEPNLDFAVGDIATQVFDPGALDAILNSSVLHHVTSFGAYRHAAAGEALAAQVPQLRSHGVLVVRDFLAPAPGRVWLDVPTDDGDDSDDPRSCSSAALLRRFAAEFRSLHAQPGFALEERDGAKEHWQRFALDARMAVEFVLRKDYRTDWESEVKEEYTYFTQQQFEACYAALGLRVLASTPVRNPWIVRNRFDGKFELRNEAGEQIEAPATNYVIVGERVSAELGVRLAVADDVEPLGFLQLSTFRHRTTGQRRDLVSRPHLTVDAVPWFEHEDALFVLARMGYPRPVLTTGGPALDGSTAPGYITEPLTVLAGDAPLGETLEVALRTRAGIESDEIRNMQAGTTYLPSPGGLREEVRSMFVEVEPRFVQHDIPQVSGYSTSGRVAAVEARQLLRAAQVGGLPDARLELNVYDLLRRTGRSRGPWIGAGLALPDRDSAMRPAGIESLRRAARRCFVPQPPDATSPSAGFLRLRAAAFAETSAAGDELHRHVREFVEPTRYSTRTVSTALLCRLGGVVHIALDDDDQPAAQCVGGNSEIWVTPAWRLPPPVDALAGAERFVEERLRDEYGVVVADRWWLGGRYHPSPGATAEVVHPLAFDVTAVAGADKRPLTWVPLHELLARPEHLIDGHLRIVAERSAHALAVTSPR